jgi:hypothetical protein
VFLPTPCRASSAPITMSRRKEHTIEEIIGVISTWENSVSETH